jgi:pimeloyl-ACP methyl ester carboxylesterase
MPVTCASRNAVSGVTPRFPRMISFKRGNETPSRMAKALCDTPSGLRNSSSNISPGCVGGRCDGSRRATSGRARDRLVVVQQLRLPTREGETFVVACGPERAPPLLLLHGSGGNATMWMDNVAAWASHFRVYAVDLVGEPGLSAPSRPPLASGGCCLWLDDVVRALLLPRVSIVGVSLGGWLALDYASRWPERVDRVVALCPSGVGRQRASFVFKAMALLMLGRRGRRAILAMLAGPARANAAQAEPQLAAFVLLVFKHFRPRSARVPILGDDALRRLTMPLLLIAGGRDALLDSADSRRRLERCAPRLTVRLLPEAGHFLPDQTVAVLEFLRSTSA